MKETDVIDIAIRALGLMGLPESKVVVVSNPGSSGNRVVLLRAGSDLYAVKCSLNPRVPASLEQRRRNALAAELPGIPEVFHASTVDGVDVLISAAPGTDSLHNLMLLNQNADERYAGVWECVCQTLLHLWLRSRAEFHTNSTPRPFHERLQRIEHALHKMRVSSLRLQDVWDLPVSINGMLYPSIAASLQSLQYLRMPGYSTTCHGDPQPSNVVVGQKYHWSFVDFEWSGPDQDWRMMLSHLHGWWSTRHLQLVHSPLCRVSAGVLHLQGGSLLPQRFRPYQRLAREVYQQMPGSTSDAIAVNQYLAALYFGELRFLSIWKREQFAIDLLVQGIITAAECASRTNAHFIFSA